MLKLIDYPIEHQEHNAFFIGAGREHFSAASRLMALPALDANGFPLIVNGVPFITPEYLESALVLFQLSFELLLKSLIKLTGKQPPKKGWDGHDLHNLWNLATVDFPALCAIQKEDVEVLKELSAIREDDSNLMRVKYQKSCLSLPEGVAPLLESFTRIYHMINGEVKALVSQKIN